MTFLRQRWHNDAEPSDYQRHVEAILNMVDTARSRPSKYELANGVTACADDRSSRNIQLLTSILSENDVGLERLMFDARRAESPLSKRTLTRSVTSALRDQNRSEAARRLHTLVGLGDRDQQSERRNFFRQ